MSYSLLAKKDSTPGLQLYIASIVRRFVVSRDTLVFLASLHLDILLLTPSSVRASALS